ncbi:MULTISPECIES: hypothetical protein [unclassified Breznakia]|uniref:hypothetical protein n=1 Tax=unclassified Breznakia TaxID=2623764 RepID=UPI0024735993|nr:MULTISPECIES: hypothetical protein [unclassified Breznakia]MDH6367526.1 FtsZ-binding cell division protein ZapB [Breznakia sp. PH1-1]MDH6404680.1 FtsZ-binding cell division protein ZapB [Breznakia sp. PF1-11]MDH6412356.1 FtsZ-binding cell division protein ZapB [Breznakia sp. PFB1-11]MDH6414694.1 FtsZ-binding cell division protein ZapB [Breznakia sp. PFB1-14]MDH6417061.1 FtsZ-binding cell division protein ZapB [Breznakia sp. PFB1-4]
MKVQVIKLNSLEDLESAMNAIINTIHDDTSDENDAVDDEHDCETITALRKENEELRLEIAAYKARLRHVQEVVNI